VEPKPSKSDMERIAGRCKARRNGCVTWEGATRDGYGLVRVAGVLMSVHRAVWIHYHGRIPKNLVILHACDMRACCNPSHLTLGTAKANFLDMVRKGRKR